MKQLRIAAIALFLCILLTLGVLTAALPQETYSPQENRYLTTFPAFSWAGLNDGTYQNDITDAMNDQFPLRSQSVAAATAIRKALGARDIGGVYLGKDGYYFEKKQNKDISQQQFQTNLRLIERYAAQGRQTSVMLVPDAGIVLQEYLPACAQMYDADALYQTAQEKLTVDRVDVLPALQKVGASAYYKTDHHWTSRGAYAALQVFLNQKNITSPDYEQAGFQTASSDFYGTLYSKVLDASAKPDTVDYLPTMQATVTLDGKAGELYQQAALQQKDQYQFFLGGNCGLTELNGGCKNGKTILLIKDSFANCFAPLLTPYYETVLMVDLRYYGGSVKTLVAERQVDETLFLFSLSSFAAEPTLSKILL